MTRWRPAATTDVDRLTALFAACEQADPVGLDVDPDQFRARLALPGLDLARDTLVAEDAAGRLVAYAEVADMGPGPGVLRIRLTSAIDPSARDTATPHVHDWLNDRAAQLRRERRPDLPGMLGTRCGASDQRRLDLLTAAGFAAVRWEQTLVRDLDQPVPSAPAPAGVSLVPFDPRYDEQTRLTHNEAYADSPTAMIPGRESWPAHATGLPAFLPEASVLALASDGPDGNPVVGFLFTLDHVDARGRAAALLHCLGTRPAWQGRGVASAMIAQTLVTSREAGHRRAELHVGSDNGVAVRLYARLGFSDTGRGHAILTRQLPAD
ncbi:GNAT family N-acetyltransferase [Micromonospora sp. NBC_00898]|uniref:GNAT family N-acetyltransferase n=1 Tax=Micromonospora sp. NBC_00898 TaxID=2975981 RepID=UPI0038661180|nr:GNAT family N-acetyltransferase [Micromonospora sp. NBC_00898]